MHGNTIDIPLNAVDLDPTYYPREELDEGRILEFRELLRDPESAGLIPPIEVVPHPTRPGHFLCPEGWHRIHAYLDENRATIPAVFLPPGTDVFVHAVQRAAITAKPLSRVEKRSAVTRLLEEHPDWSNHRIAEVVGVSRPFVASLRAGGNIAPPQQPPREDGEPEADGVPAVQRGPDPVQQGLRLLLKGYTRGYARTKLGFGKAINPKAIRHYLERIPHDDYETAVSVLRAWAVALADEDAWLPEEG
jgi:ParB-like chromosome segregation protein Spo0J